MLKKLNEDRGRFTIKDRLFNEILHTLFQGVVNIGVGVILILATRSIRDGIFTIGDFALFTLYLGYLNKMSTFGGLIIARYKQISVSVQRIHELMESSEKDSLYKVVSLCNWILWFPTEKKNKRRPPKEQAMQDQKDGFLFLI